MIMILFPKGICAKNISINWSSVKLLPDKVPAWEVAVKLGGEAIAGVS